MYQNKINLEEVKQIELNILCEFASFCNLHNLKCLITDTNTDTILTQITIY